MSDIVCSVLHTAIKEKRQVRLWCMTLICIGGVRLEEILVLSSLARRSGFELMAENWPEFWICMHPRAAFNESICREENMNYICTNFKFMHKKCVLYMYLFVASLSSSA